MLRRLALCLVLGAGVGCDAAPVGVGRSAEPAPPAPTVYFDPSPASFFEFPWPSDARLLPGGHPDMEGFPNPYDVDILALYLTSMETDIVGFGNNSPAYFQLSASLDTTTLPVTLADGASADASVQIFNVDPLSAGYGERVPTAAFYAEEATAYNPPHLLAVAPAWGFPLRGGTTYAVVLTRALRGIDGTRLVAPAGLAALARGEPSGDPEIDALGPLYAPLWEVLSQAGLPADQVVGATVFTTQDPVSELNTIRDWLNEQPAPPLNDVVYIPEQPQWQALGEEEQSYQARYTDPYDLKLEAQPYHLFEGHYTASNFQAGEVPFLEEGGQIEFDEGGDPIVQYTENLRFALAVPKGEAPAGGWPLVLFAHGTGGDYKNFLYNSGYSQVDTLISRGVAVMSIDEPLHGPRAPEGTDPDLASFNFFNPDAARSNFRQAAIDVFQEVRLAREVLAIPAEGSPTGQAITFNPERLAFMGHSHGGLSGALLLPFEDHLRAVMLSGAGGGLSLTILYRKDYVDFEELFRTLLQMEASDPLNTFHPVMGVVQTLVDITDPINYAPLFIHRPFEGKSPRHYLQSEGFYDTATPPITTEVMVTAAGLPTLAPVGRYIEGTTFLGVGVVHSPVSANVSAPGGEEVTAALAQFPEQGHPAVFRDVDGAQLTGSFLTSAVTDDVPVISWTWE